MPEWLKGTGCKPVGSAYVGSNPTAPIGIIRSVTATRLVRTDDAEVLAGLVSRNRAFLAPWDLVRDEEYFTVDGQAQRIERALGEHERGAICPYVILEGDGRVVGRITLDGIERGPVQSCHLGYWVDEDHNSHGLATAAVATMLGVAFDELELHRVQAATLPHNAASQRVLERNGFERIGLARGYLRIAGRWQDHILFQRLSA